MTPREEAGRTDDRRSLWQAFILPPDEARPRAWWHWMDGNVDPAGIRRDLTWIHSVGVRGVQLFDGGMGVPLVVPQAVRPGSALWAEAIDTAIRTSDELGLELAVATSSGWSAAGAPWVLPEDAMKKVVWSETIVAGGGPRELSLRPLPAVAGLYQDTQRAGGGTDAGYSTEWIVLAVPHRREGEALLPSEVDASAPLPDWMPLVDGDFDGVVTLPRDPEAWSEGWIEQRFDNPVTVRSVVVGLPAAGGFGAAPPPDAVLQVSDDGVVYRDVVRLSATSVPARTASFPATTGRRFRLVLSGASAADALPPTSPGVRLPPVLRRAHEFRVSEFALRADARVHHAEVKAGFGVVPDYYAIECAEDTGAVDVAHVIDLTSRTSGGVLRWDAPAGDWLVIRLGASLTGQTNGPAPADSTGLEVDKLHGGRVAAYLTRHLARFGGTDATPSRFAALLSDSIEAGPQNWTDDIREEFRRRRGYDPLPWLPALTGRIMGSADESDRFLYDYRRTLAELLASEYYGTLGEEARARGMSYYAEALEDRRPSLGDDLAMRAAADVPMGAMWTYDPEDGPRPTYVADLRGAASVAHVHGKRWVGSEAFTSFDSPWSWTPRTLKHVADLQLALGVTRFCIHTSPHQPLAAPPPGIALAPFLGQSFSVNETWAASAGPWVDYLARCSAVLASGRPVVDAAVFVGEEAPVTGLYGQALDASLPDGISIDYIGPDALRDVLRVEGGTLVSDGAEYRMLHLGGSSTRMTLAALDAVERLVDAGALVSGARPAASPSLADDPAEFDAVCDRLWGAGRVEDHELRDALSAHAIEPGLAIEGGPVRRISRVVDGDLITFVANPTGAELRLRLRPERPGPLEAWDPVRTSRALLPPVDTAHTAFDIVLAPFGSLFVLPAASALPHLEPDLTLVPLHGAWRVAVPGGDEHVSSPDPQLWTDSGPHERGFSGTAAYRHSFVLDPAHVGRSIEIDLAEVRDIARVVVNGVDCGVVWTAPFRADITSAVRVGPNTLEVEVSTPWRNRLIAEAAHPTGEIFAPMTGVFDPDADPLPAGLAGTCVLRIAAGAF